MTLEHPFCFNSAPFGAFFALCGTCWATSRDRIMFKNVFQAYWCRLSPLVLEIKVIFLFLFWPHLGSFFALFKHCWAVFRVRVRFKKFVGTYSHRLTTFILKVQLYWSMNGNFWGFVTEWVSEWVKNWLLERLSPLTRYFHRTCFHNCSP